MSGELLKGADQLLIETMGHDPLVVVRKGRGRDFKKLRNELHNPDYSIVSDVVKHVRRSRSPVTMRGAEPGASAYHGIPVAGSDNAITGVHVTFGQEPLPDPPRVAAFHWELDTPTKVPRLILSSEYQDIIGTPAEFRDRSVYGPLDFCNRIVRMRDLYRVWEQIATAGPDTAAAGRLLLRDDSAAPIMLHYACRYVSTDVGPRLRVLCQDVTASAALDPRDISLETLDATIAGIAISNAKQYGALVDFRWPAPVVLKWLTPYFRGTGHGVSTGQASGLHPEDLARMPDIIAPALAGGIATDRIRTRNPAGGWIWSAVTIQIVDPELMPTLALVLFTPGPTDAPSQPPARHLPLPFTSTDQ
ncbi:GAF domain-containing protein [Nocardia transvalensis]|uniref:GAF domain-containing protein n=1 Tax=Nocardia transvalensis TaxID=37333 RepID=UPI00189537FD|nr:GAF domain-containing protein [Nocardia transvalensis]MBF6333634.1 DUF5593 domain-containing protein [Nocardia transvalensis]